MWADILIEKKEIKRAPRKGKTIIEILEVFSGSPAAAIGLKAGQQLLVSKRADDWEGLEEAKSKGPISLTVLNEDGCGGVELKLKHFPFGFQHDLPLKRLMLATLKHKLTGRDLITRMLKLDQQGFFKAVDQLRSLQENFKFNLFDRLRLWALAKGDENFDRYCVDGIFAIEALLKGIFREDVTEAIHHLEELGEELNERPPQILAAFGTALVELIQATGEEDKDNAIGYMAHIFSQYKEGRLLYDTVLKLVGGELDDSSDFVGGPLLKENVPLYKFDPAEEAPEGLSEPDQRVWFQNKIKHASQLDLKQEIAALKPGQFLLLNLIGNYRANGYYARDMFYWGQVYPHVSEIFTKMLVCTYFTPRESEYHYWLRGEEFAKDCGAPFTILYDKEAQFQSLYEIYCSPFIMIVDHNGVVVSDGWLHHDGAIWQALARERDTVSA